MVQEENNVREEIALRIWRETLTNKGNIAKWTGLSYEQVCRLVRGVRRLEGCWGDLSSVMDELVTLAKRGDLHARRQAAAYVRNVVVDEESGQTALQKLFNEIGPKYADRKGGYTRVIKTRIRRGDAAPMAIVEFVK